MIQKELRDFGAELRQLRGKMTLREAGEKTGHHFTYLSFIELGKRLPRWKTLQKILRVYADGAEDLDTWSSKYLRVKTIMLKGTINYKKK